MQVSRSFRFEAAHRLLGYNGACANLHGHSYKAVVTIEASDLEDSLEDSMVVDFKSLDKMVGTFIRNCWDHVCILKERDPLIHSLLAAQLPVYQTINNPTAEIMAQILFRSCSEFYTEFHGSRISVVSVTIHETADNWATCTSLGRQEASRS
jgi:6-pyruvoyltetrahydropterin/6-carboxytetrahydropterin synthase